MSKKDVVRTEKKPMFIAVLTVIAALFIAGSALASALAQRIDKPDPKKSPQDAARFLASEKFNRLSPNEQRDYLRSMGRDRRKIMRLVPASQRRQAMRNMRREHMREMDQKIKEFWTKSRAEQIAQLDAEIARMKQMRERMEARRKQQGQNAQPGARGNGPGGGPGGQPRTPPSAQARRERYESSNPADRAQRRAYMDAVRARAQSTGQSAGRPR